MHAITNRILSVIIFALIASNLFPQGVKGRVTDKETNPVPYPVIYDEATHTGITGNADGYYEFKLDAGNHSLIYKALGYHMVKRDITTANQYITINIKLNVQPVQISEVVVRPDKEDPAYAIMRRAIGLAPYHLNQIKEYLADVYLRGTIYIIKIPKIIARNIQIDGKKNLIKNGDVFLEESFNEISFRSPDTYEQKVMSYRNTYPFDAEGVSPAWIIGSSLYQDEFEGIISPMAPNAFSFYKYRYEGYFSENENIIYKIKVIPKRNSQQLMQGYIYIADKIWCLHSVDASLKMFFGTMNYKTMYAPVKGTAWLPISYQFYLDAKIMGISGNYKYSASVKYKNLLLNEEIAVEPFETHEDELSQNPPRQDEPDVKSDRDQQKIEELLAKEELSNRDMVKLATLMSKETTQDTVKNKALEIKDSENTITIEKDALNEDTAYWNTLRPIPLTTFETQLPELKDRTTGHAGDSVYTGDSTVTVGAGIRLGKIPGFIFFGREFRAFDSTLRIQYHGLIGINKFDFNTVDGLIYRQTFSLRQKIDASHTLNINPGIAYAFIRKKIMWWTDISYDYAPMRNGNLHFHIGSESVDYNAETGINHTMNSIASLFFRRNYLKLYQQNKMYLSNQIDLANGLFLTTTIGYQTAQPLSNHSDYSFFFRSKREYSPNIPVNDSVHAIRNLHHEEAYWDIGIEFTPRYFYRVSGGRKYYQYSKFPTLYFRNRISIPGIVKSTADYDLLEIGIRQKIEWPIMHAFYYDIKGGFFLNSNNVYLMNNKYFNNQDLPVNILRGDNVFHLVPYYRNSTCNNYLEAHVRFTTPYLLIKYLPFLSDKLWCENLHLHYLKTKEQPNYWEISYSVSQIYMMGSIGIYAGFKGTSYDSYGIQVLLEL